MESGEYESAKKFSYCRISAIALSYAMGGKFDRKGPLIALIEGIQVSEGGAHWLHESGHGAVIKWTISIESISLVGYCFVDGYTIILVSPDPYISTKDLIKIYQKRLNIFLGAAQAVGRKFSQSKTKCYLLEFI